RYHARDAAAVRARLEGARLLLGSATPSLEALHWGETGRLRVFGLPERIGDRPLPPVDVVDLREAPRGPAAGAGPGRHGVAGAARAGGRGGAVDRGAGRRGARRAGAPRAGDPAAQPARLRHLPPVPELRRRARVPTLRDRAHGPPHAAGAALPLLRLRGTG